jgi:hypothetical protein
LELNFTGEDDHHVEKLRTLAIEGLFKDSSETGEESVSSKKPSQPDIILLSLAGGKLGCHSFPELERLEFFDETQIIDFEPYTNQFGPKVKQHMLAVLFRRVLKIY